MGWSSKWNDKKPQIVDTQKPYSEILREHNAAAEADFKNVVKEIVKDNTFIVHCDFGSHDRSSCIIMRGNEIIAEARSTELSIPIGWNTFKANALQIGDLAVVLSTDDPEEHCMVHVPTQTWFDNAMPEYKGDGEGYSIEQLCLWAWKVQQDFNGHFEHLKTFNNKSYKNASPKVLNDLKNLCHSIKVE